MKQNRILHISPTDIRYDSRILKELNALGALPNSTIMAFGIDDREDKTYDINHQFNIKTFNLLSKKVTFLPRPVKLALNTIEAFFKLIFPIKRYKPTIIHCHDTLYLPIALVGKFICKSKLIYDAHELESDKAGQSRILSRYTLFVEKYSWNRIDMLIGASPSQINWYNDNIGQKESLLVLNSPIFNEKLIDNVKNDYLRKKFKIPTENKIFLYLGIIGCEGRGVKLYLDTFQNKDIDSHLVFIGYGEYAEEVEKISKNYQNIHYHEAVPHDKVVEISNSADIGLCMIEHVSLSDYYCLPNKFFEYAFSGLYILATDFPDMKLILDRYDLGECCKYDEKEFQKAVKSIESRKIIKEQRNLNLLSWEHQAEQLNKKYYKLINIENNPCVEQ